MAWANRRAAAASSVRSFFTLPLVSMASVRFSGISDCFSKTAICCGRPSSVTAKSSRVSPATMAPFLSVTFTNTFTSLTSTCSVRSCVAAGKARLAIKMQPG